MSKVSQFVDNMFAAAPSTPEMQAAKVSITEIMEDKYEALVAEGKNEHEALGILVTEFGNIDEILAEFELKKTTAFEAEPVEATEATTAYTQDFYPDPYFLEEYEEFQKKFAVAMTIGVVMCIMAIVSIIVTTSVFRGNDVIPIAVFFIIIAGAVAIFVYFGMQKERFEKQRKQYELLMANEDPKKYYSRKKLAETISGLIMMVATCIYLIGGSVFNMWHPGWLIFPIGGILCGIVSVALGVEDS